MSDDEVDPRDADDGSYARGADASEADASEADASEAEAPDADVPETDAPDADAGDAASDDGSEWQFTLQDLEDREAEAEAAAAAERRRKEPLEAGDPTVENTLFVLLGVVFALFVISRLFVA